MRYFMIGALTIGLMSITSGAQQPTQPQNTGQEVTPKLPYSSTVAQLAFEREKNAQLTAKQMQDQFRDQMNDLQKKFADYQKSYDEFIDETRKANGWDASYVYDPDADKWIHHIQVATPKKK